MGAKLRHLALSVPDRNKAAEFYEKTFGMERIADRQSDGAHVVYLSDGVMNLALIEYQTDEAAGRESSDTDQGKEFVGLHHLGFWVDDTAEAKAKAEENGGQYIMGEAKSGGGFYEVKYRDPNGIIFDITHNGWAGARKEVTDEPKKIP